MRDGENGLLVDIDDAAGFARAVGAILADSALAGTLVDGGRRTLMTQFSEQAVADAYVELFRRKP
jgi:glycosyltransferase involved in cell wall biosynthesis